MSTLERQPGASCQTCRHLKAAVGGGRRAGAGSRYIGHCGLPRSGTKYAKPVSWGTWCDRFEKADS